MYIKVNDSCTWERDWAEILSAVFRTTSDISLTNQNIVRVHTSIRELNRYDHIAPAQNGNEETKLRKFYSHCCCFVPVLRTLASTSVVIFSRQVFIVCFCLLYVAVICNSGTAFFCVIQHWKILMKSSGTARVAIFVWPRDSQAHPKFSKIRHYSWFQPM